MRTTKTDSLNGSPNQHSEKFAVLASILIVTTAITMAFPESLGRLWLRDATTSVGQWCSSVYDGFSKRVETATSSSQMDEPSRPVSAFPVVKVSRAPEATVSESLAPPLYIGGFQSFVVVQPIIQAEVAYRSVFLPDTSFCERVRKTERPAVIVRSGSSITIRRHRTP